MVDPGRRQLYVEHGNYHGVRIDLISFYPRSPAAKELNRNELMDDEESPNSLLL
jgi:hypothetical protein